MQCYSVRLTTCSADYCCLSVGCALLSLHHPSVPPVPSMLSPLLKLCMLTHCRCLLHLLHRPCLAHWWQEVGHDSGWSLLLHWRHSVCVCPGPGHAHHWPCLPRCRCRLCQPGMFCHVWTESAVCSNSNMRGAICILSICCTATTRHHAY